MSTERRIKSVVVAPAGAPIFDDQAWTVDIEDDAGGEFLVIQCNDDQCANGQIRMNPKEWPAIRDAIEFMIEQVRK